MGLTTVKQVAPYISLTSSGGEVTVAVDDSEVLDYVEDFFMERVGGAFKEFTLNLSSKPLLMQFTSQVTAEEVESKLRLLDVAEIQRIYALNN
jgi:hypothetical protein